MAKWKEIPLKKPTPTPEEKPKKFNWAVPIELFTYFVITVFIVYVLFQSL